MQKNRHCRIVSEDETHAPSVMGQGIARRHYRSHGAITQRSHGAITQTEMAVRFLKQRLHGAIMQTPHGAFAQILHGAITERLQCHY